MGTDRDAPTLQNAHHIGLIGDDRGDIDQLMLVAQFLTQHDVRVLLTVGGSGFLRPGTNWANNLQHLSARLAELNQVLLWPDVRREDIDSLARFPVDADGLRHIAPNIIQLPRGYRSTFASGKSFAALGGANAIDRGGYPAGTQRAEASITESDLDALGHEHADMLVGYEAPLDILSLDRWLEKQGNAWPEEAMATAQEDREMFHRGFLQTSPTLSVGGRYRHHIDEINGHMTNNTGFATRTVLLDTIESRDVASTAILDVDTLELRYLTSNGTELPAPRSQVTDLTTQRSGRWRVHTVRSHHIVDLDKGTVERLPGPNSHSTTSDGLHYLRTLDQCRIGDVGRWTTRGDYLIDYYWHRSSIIRQLERLSPVPELRELSGEAIA